MEIQDYLRVLGKRAWLLVMIPAVAGVAAGLIAVQQPQAFRTTATLQLPRNQNNSAPAQVAQQVADFKAAAANSSVQNAVARSTGVPVKRIKKLNIAQVGVSSQLTMGMQGKQKNPSDAKAVITGVATNALNYLQAPDLASGQKAVDAANAKVDATQQSIDKATNDLNALLQRIHSVTPQDDLAEARRQASAYQQSYTDAVANLQTTQAAVFKQAMDQANARVLVLSNAIFPVTDLQNTIANGNKDLATDQTERDDAVKALAAISTSPDLVFSAEGTPVIRKTRVVKTAAAAVVAGFPLAIGIVLLLDALQRRRQAKRAAQADRETFPVSEDESEVPVAAGAALLVGSRASPGPVAGAEPTENGRSAHIAAKEPALLVGARATTATAAVMDEDDEDDDEPDDEGQPGPLGSADDEDELDVDEPVAVDIGDEEDDEDKDDADLVATDLVDEEDEDDADGEADVDGETDDDATAAEDEDAPAGALAEGEEDEDDEDDAALLAEDEDDLDTDDELDDLGADDELEDEDSLATADDLDDDLGDDDELDASADELEDLEDEDDLDADDDLLDEDDEDEDGDDLAMQNGQGRVHARVPDAEEAFEDDDEGHEPST